MNKDMRTVVSICLDHEDTDALDRFKAAVESIVTDGAEIMAVVSKEVF